MPFVMSTDNRLGVPDLQLYAVDTTPKVAIGTVIRAYDPVQGDGEFIYLPGVASCLAGDLVVFDLAPGAQAVVRTLSGTHVNSGRPLAVALVPVLAGQYGWFQITGCAIVNTTATFVAGSKVFLSATAGAVSTAVIAGVQVVSAFASSNVGTPAALKAYMTLLSPAVQTQIT